MDENQKKQNYNRLQLILVKAKVEPLMNKEKKTWDDSVKYILNISNQIYKYENDSNLAGHKLRFCAFFVKMLEKLQTKHQISNEDVDQVLQNYLRYLIKIGDIQNIIQIYSQIHSEERRIRGLAEFLVDIEVCLILYFL
jgi:hypothetical protein